MKTGTFELQLAWAEEAFIKAPSWGAAVTFVPSEQEALMGITPSMQGSDGAQLL